MDAPAITRRRRPFLAPLFVLGVLGVLLLAGIAVVILFRATATTTTVVVVGHGERTPGSIADPPLAPEGEQRAERLAQLFSGAPARARIDAIYITASRAIGQTAAPLAARLGLTPVLLPDKNAEAAAARALSEHRGGAVLIIAQDSLVPSLIEALSGLTVPAPRDADSSLFVVAVPSVGAAGLLQLSY
jgi:Histidine phosphatase superfamily (branch 1)